MHDRLLLWRCSLARDVLDALLDDNFYAAACRLKHTRDNAYIGLRVLVIAGKICAIPWYPFSDALLTSTDGRAPRLIAQQSFGSKRTQAKGIMGHLVHILGFASCPLPALRSCLFLQLVELSSAGYALPVLSRLVWHVHTPIPFLHLPERLRTRDLCSGSFLLLRRAHLQSCMYELTPTQPFRFKLFDAEPISFLTDNNFH